MQKISINPKLTLVFGLKWYQHDEIDGKSPHRQIGAWRDEGYRYAATYPHIGGKVFGLYKPPAIAQPKFDKTCVSGAAVIATHPELAGQTGIVLIQFEEEVENDQPPKTSVIFVGLRAGVVVMDYIIDPHEILDYRNNFLQQYLASEEEPRTWGDLSGSNRVDNPFELAQCTPSKAGGKACPVVELRSSRVFVVVGILAAVAVLAGVGFIVWQINQSNAEEMKRRLAASENTPPVLYAREIKRWEAREVNFVAPSIAYMRDELRAEKFPIHVGGFALVKVSCFGEQCSAQWKRETGNLDEFRARAPESWKVVNALSQDLIDTVIDLKLPKGKIDRAGWPKYAALKDQLTSHWQLIYSAGWRATLGAKNQLAIPGNFTPEQKRAIVNYEGAPHGVDVEIVSQQWWFVDKDINAPLQAEHLGEQVELTEPIVVSYDGKIITFSLKGVMYVQN